MGVLCVCLLEDFLESLKMSLLWNDLLVLA